MDLREVAESDRWSMVSLDVDDGASIISETPTTNFEMDPTIMLHRRYQKAYPSLYRRMAKSDWQSSIVSNDQESEYSPTIAIDPVLSSTQLYDLDKSDEIISLHPFIDGHKDDATSMIYPADLVRLSIDVGPKFSVALGATSLNPVGLIPEIDDHNGKIPDPDSNLQPGIRDWRNEAATSEAKADKDLIKISSYDVDSPGDLDEELIDILSDDNTLMSEIDVGLIGKAVIPIPRNAIPEKDIFYPAYILNLMLSELWNNGLVKESQNLMASFMTAIQGKVFTSDNVLVSGTFWLTNVHEILSFVFIAEGWYEEQKLADPDFASLLVIAGHDLGSLEFNIYHTIVGSLKRKLQTIIIPAVVEYQALPGCQTRQATDKLRANGDLVSEFDMNDLLRFFNDVVKVMQAFYIDDESIHQLVLELVLFVGIISFNDLLQRKGFLSWKRALQIHYNITRIEVWCKSHGMPEAFLPLEQLLVSRWSFA